MKKQIFVGLVIIAIIALAIIFYRNTQNTVTDNIPSQNSSVTDNTQSLSLEIISTDNIKTIYSVDFINGLKLENILTDFANNKGDFTFVVEKSSFGDYITTINDKKADPSKEFWNIKVNGKDSTTGISDITPSSNDTITFSLLTF